MADTKEVFLQNVAKHELTILRDDGVYRHVRLAEPDCWNRYFELITFPQHLCYTGDMGTYVFQRLDDMFKFFRRSTQSINPDYWAEKVVAEDRDRVTRFRRDKLRKWVVGEMRNALRDSGLSAEGRREVFDEVRDVLVSADDLCEEEIRKRLADISASPRDRNRYPLFDGLWEVDFNEYTPRFIWCCHAIVWGIQQYDAHLAGNREA